jgi:hypothetical protein
MCSSRDISLRLNPGIGALPTEIANHGATGHENAIGIGVG